MKAHGVIGIVTVLGMAAVAAPDCRAGAAAPPTANSTDHVRLCGGYGPGFFAVPDSNGCIRVGGLVMAEVRGVDPRYRLEGIARPVAAAPTAASGITRTVPAGASIDALGRVEIDIRQQTEAGPVRAFLRVDGVASPFTRP